MVFDTYGRDHAALCSTVIRYRAKGALRDAGKALSLPEDLIKLLSSQVWRWSREGIEPKHAEELNLNPGDRRLRLAIANGYERDFAEKTFKQLEGFGSYGFPESHAASFALIAYASSWLKCHHPDVFCAALLNAQPMGFYAPAQIVRDARDHGGVDVRPVCVNASRFDCTLEPTEEGDRFAVRLGLRTFPLPHGHGDELNHGSPGLDPRSLPPKGLEVRDVHFPDLHIDTIKMKTREFR